MAGGALGAVAPPPSRAAGADAARVIELTNAARLRAGVAPLVANPALAAAAQGYAAVLAGGACWAHTCGPEPDLAGRACGAGYAGWTTLGENLAAGQRTPEEAVAAWLGSEGHRATLLDGALRETGVGVAHGGRLGTYWAQELGARRPEPAPVP